MQSSTRPAPPVIVANTLKEPARTCLDACDFDDDGAIDITDPIANLRHQFLLGPTPPAPGAASCGEDPTGDALACEAHESCR